MGHNLAQFVSDEAVAGAHGAIQAGHQPIDVQLGDPADQSQFHRLIGARDPGHKA
jgi:hypothetical protein